MFVLMRQFSAVSPGHNGWHSVRSSKRRFCATSFLCRWKLLPRFEVLFLIFICCIFWKYPGISVISVSPRGEDMAWGVPPYGCRWRITRGFHFRLSASCSYLPMFSNKYQFLGTSSGRESLIVLLRSWCSLEVVREGWEVDIRDSVTDAFVKSFRISARMKISGWLVCFT